MHESRRADAEETGSGRQSTPRPAPLCAEPAPTDGCEGLRMVEPTDGADEPNAEEDGAQETVCLACELDDSQVGIRGA